MLTEMFQVGLPWSREVLRGWLVGLAFPWASGPAGELSWPWSSRCVSLLSCGQIGKTGRGRATGLLGPRSPTAEQLLRARRVPAAPVHARGADSPRIFVAYSSKPPLHVRGLRAGAPTERAAVPRASCTANHRSPRPRPSQPAVSAGWGALCVHVTRGSSSCVAAACTVLGGEAVLPGLSH